MFHKVETARKTGTHRSLNSWFNRLLWYALPYLFCVDNCFAVPAEPVEEGKVEAIAQKKPLYIDDQKGDCEDECTYS
ncbi:MAG: hypothetical protein J5789_05595 [Oscillospiraceae bacterium]|nr:hypothetical protein [Oscillospiraceae bacterium]MBR5701772.1 hypothetical protein [Oscillospiraceae bacterium]